MKLHNKRLATLSRRLDPLWWFIARALRLRKIGSNLTKPRSILLVDLHLLGDLVMLVPLLRVIRRFHPNAHVGLMAGPWSGPILAGTGLVDEFITLRAPWVSKGQGFRGVVSLLRAIQASRVRKWDWGIDVRGDARNILLLTLAGAQRRIAYDFTGGSELLTDVVPDDGALRHIVEHHAALAQYLFMPMTADERIPKLDIPDAPGVTKLTSRRVVGVHFGASMILRRMPIAEAVELVLSILGRENSRIVLVDAPDTHDLNSALIRQLPPDYAAGVERWEGDLPGFIRFLKTLDEFYAMDSGPAHLAAALGVETTVFFGPNLPHAVRPMGSNVAIVERKDVSCRPCDQRNCTNSSYQECLRHVVRFLEPARVRAASMHPSNGKPPL